MAYHHFLHLRRYPFIQYQCPSSILISSTICFTVSLWRIRKYLQQAVGVIWCRPILAFQPGNWVMQRYSVSKTVAVSMFAWGGALRHCFFTRVQGSVSYRIYFRQSSFSAPLQLGTGQTSWLCALCKVLHFDYFPLPEIGRLIVILLGLTESIVSPAFLLITGLSYRKEEHAMRCLIWGTSQRLKCIE